MTTNLDAAIEYAQRGWFIFPCHSIKDGKCTCGAARCTRPGKHPSTEHGFKDASCDVATVTRWWTSTPNANIGLYADGSGLCLVDVDPDKGGTDSLNTMLDTFGDEILDTLQCETGGGGIHLYYRKPAGVEIRNKANNVLPGIDTRTAGYVILPPSNHKSGGSYRWLNDLPIEEMPAGLVEMFRVKIEPQSPSAPVAHVCNDNARIEAYGRTALDAEIRELADARPGSQNDALNRCAFNLGQLVAGGVLSEAEVTNAIERTVLAWPCSDGPWTRENMAHTLNSGLRSGMKSPRGVPPGDSVKPAEWGEWPEMQNDESEPAAVATSGKKAGDTVNQIACAWAELVADSYIYTSNDQWWEYNAGRWMMVDDAYVGRSVREFALPVLGDKITPRKITDIVRMAQYLLLHNVAEMGGALHLIPFRNGVYDIHDGAFTRHDPSNLLTRQLQYDYDPDAKCPRFLRFLNQVLLTQSGEPCHEWIDVMQEWFGYLLLAESSAQTAMVWLGTGANGKGVLTKVIEAFVGSDYVTAIAVDQLKDPYHRADLFGKMLGTTGDLDRTDMRHAAGWFKAIVGGDTISARHPAGKVFHFRPALRMVISCNDLPDTQDMSYGYFRRLLIIDFRASIAEAQKVVDLPERLITEMSGIFNWALDGLKRFEERGRRFTASSESDAVKIEYRAQQDPVAGFIADCCERSDDETCWAWVDVLYDSYVAYCFREALKSGSRQAFGMGLSRNGVPAAVCGWDADNASNRKLRKGIEVRSGK